MQNQPDINTYNNERKTGCKDHQSPILPGACLCLQGHCLHPLGLPLPSGPALLLWEGAALAGAPTQKFSFSGCVLSTNTSWGVQGHKLIKTCKQMPSKPHFPQPLRIKSSLKKTFKPKMSRTRTVS